MNVLLRLSIALFILLPFAGSLTELVRLALDDDRYTYTLLVPFGVAALIWFRFLDASPIIRSRLGLAAGIAASTTLLGAAGLLGQDWPLSLRILILVCASWAAVGTLCGPACFRQAFFPLAVLFILIPLPYSWMDRVVGVLQIGSADTAFGLFKLMGIPVHREGPFLFALPGIVMEVAEECSGIRSTTSLFVSSIVAVCLTLDGGWRRFLVILMVLPVSIFKNALRIVTLSYLGIYVDPSYLSGELHRQGGIPFSIIAMVVLGSIILWLRRRGAAAAGVALVPRVEELSVMPIDRTHADDE